MFRALVKKELIQLYRDPRLLAMIVVMPVLLLILFGVALKLEPSNVKMAVYKGDRSFFTDLIETHLWMEGYFDMYEVDSREAIVEEIRSGRAKAGLFIDSDFSSKLVENAQPHIVFYVDGTMPSLTTAMKYHSDSTTDEEVTNDMYFLDPDEANVVIAEDPFIMDTTILFNPDEKETWFFLPGVIGVLVMQVALILTGISVVREREKGTLEQLLVTPLSKTMFVFGKLSPYIIIALLDFYFILGTGWLIFDLPQPSSQILLFLLAVIFVIAMISLGLLISLIATTQQQAMFIAIFIIVPSMLLSGFIFPLEAIPESVRYFCYAIPFTYFIEAIRGLLIRHSDIRDILPAMALLSGFCALFVLASIFKFKTTV
jgi:ABC-2 type transport system permease protein